MPFYKVYSPPAALATVVRELQVFHANWNKEPGLAAPFITCLANTEQNLYFYVHDPIKLVTAERHEVPVPPVVVTGPKYQTAGLLFGKDHLMIKVAFHPTGTYRLLGLPMEQTVNTGFDATRFWGDEVQALLQQLRAEQHYDAMVETVTRFLEQKCCASCRPEEPIDRVAIEMLDPANDHSLEEWAQKACLSRRQFERSFATRVGLSPKLFIRIVRFEWAMRVKNECPQKSWSAIALECGYTDASHLLREFRQFAEFAPGKFYEQPTSGYSSFPTG